MSNPSPTDTPLNGSVEAAHEWLHRNGNNVAGIEQKLNGGDTEGFAARKMVIKRKIKKKDDGPLEIVCSWVVENQIGLSVNLLMLLAMTHLCFPRARRHTRKFYKLSYYNPETGEYCSGWNDAFMVSYWIVVFTGLRAAVMDYILVPLARKGGVRTTRNRTRFAEQAWLLIYCSVFWTLGMYILVNSDYWLNLKELWTDWPNREIPALRKWYILVQYAFWLQQIMVINIEARRKDHWQMFTHHIVTTMLIFTSYGYHQTKVANLILCMMDVLDILLAIAKCLKYLGFGTICDVIFGLFMLTWAVVRHGMYLMVCWSVYHDIPETISYGCYRGRNGAIQGPFPAPDRFAHLLQPFRDPEGVVCWNDSIKWGFLSALLFLQCILVMWFVMIVRVAVSVIKGGEAHEPRSEDEGEDEDGEEIDEDIEETLLDSKIVGTLEALDSKRHDGFAGHEQPPIEEEVGVEAINLKGRTSSRYRKSSSSASGVSLPGHSDRKELLGRIGCDKPV